MKIASLETGVVLLPNDEPLAGFSENPNAKNPIVWLRLRTDDGIEGLGVAYFGGALTRTLRPAVAALGALTIGEDPLRVAAIAATLRAAAGSSGPAGIGGRAGAPHSRGGRPRHGSDVRHQPALAPGAGDRYRPSRRGGRGRSVLARGRHDA